MAVVAMSRSGATASHLRPPLAASANHAPPRLHLPLPPTTNTPRVTSATRFSRSPTAVHSSSDNLTAVVASPAKAEPEYTAEEVVRRFYGGINSGDLSSVEDLISDNCVYEDLIFPAPFVGRKAIMDFFRKFIDTISRDLQFVVDDISTEDSVAVGVTWHLEWKGKVFPFSKGCSFYRLEINNGKRQIKYGRDSVEPAIKPGETALVAIKGVTWLLQQFPQLAKWL